MKTFGCLCYPWLRPYTNHKLAPKSKPCVFIGYSKAQSGYLCLDTYNNKIHISGDVLLDENIFPFSISNHSSHVTPQVHSQWNFTIDTIISPPKPVPPISSPLSGSTCFASPQKICTSSSFGHDHGDSSSIPSQDWQPLVVTPVISHNSHSGTEPGLDGRRAEA